MGTYHDGERGGVHCRAEYDAEDAVEHPKHAVEQRLQVRVRLELLHVLVLYDPPERRPAHVQAKSKRPLIRIKP